MAGRVLVEEGVVEHYAAVPYRALIGHERALAEHARALVHGDERPERLLVPAGPAVHGAPALEADPEVLDELSAVGQRPRGVHYALRLACARGDIDLFGGDVGVVHRAVDGIGLRAAEEACFGYEPDREVGAVGGAVLELHEPHGVEPPAAVREEGVVLRPVLRRVPVQRAGTGEDSFPEPLDGFTVRQSREHLARPPGAGHGGNAPLVAVLHRVAYWLGDGITAAHRLGALLLVYTGEPVRVRTLKIEHDGQAVRPAAQLLLLPGLDGAQGVHALPAVVQFRKRLVFPLHLHLGRARPVALLGEHQHKLGLVQSGAQHDGLAGHDPAARDGDEAGIPPQLLCIHCTPPC